MKSTRDILVGFGKELRAERLRQKLSQEELGARAGLHRTYVGMVERAEKNITLVNIQKLCKALDVPMWKLMRSFG